MRERDLEQINLEIKSLRESTAEHELACAALQKRKEELHRAKAKLVLEWEPLHEKWKDSHKESTDWGDGALAHEAAQWSQHPPRAASTGDPDPEPAPEGAAVAEALAEVRGIARNIMEKRDSYSYEHCCDSNSR